MKFHEYEEWLMNIKHKDIVPNRSEHFNRTTKKRKATFKTIREAIIFIKTLEHRKGASFLMWYRCTICNKFHIGVLPVAIQRQIHREVTTSNLSFVTAIT